MAIDQSKWKEYGLLTVSECIPEVNGDKISECFKRNDQRAIVENLSKRDDKLEQQKLRPAENRTDMVPSGSPMFSSNKGGRGEDLKTTKGYSEEPAGAGGLSQAVPLSDPILAPALPVGDADLERKRQNATAETEAQAKNLAESRFRSLPSKFREFLMKNIPFIATIGAASARAMSEKEAAEYWDNPLADDPIKALVSSDTVAIANRENAIRLALARDFLGLNKRAREAEVAAPAGTDLAAPSRTAPNSAMFPAQGTALSASSSRTPSAPASHASSARSI